jgi:hypothetical protein
MHVVAKRLAAVEVNPNASHQREFHAGALRAGLGFTSSEDVHGHLQVALYDADGGEPLIENCRYTLYNARRANPARAAEWRLYPETDLFLRRVQQGDLMVVVRPDPGTTLSVLVARSGTKAEEALSRALRVGDNTALRRFTVVEPRGLTERESAQLALELTPHAPTETLPPSESPLRKQLVDAAVARLIIPPSAALASATHEILKLEYGSSLSPDEFLITAIGIESSLFFAIEEGVGAARIKEVSARGGGFTEVMRLTQSMLQSRKSRMGQSLQNHLAAVLQSAHIPFTAQCPTERGERPDFIVPGRSAYHDPGFPADLLRMVGCKSRVRERWRQYDSEADRIRIKHHVSLDVGMSAELLEQMHGANLRLHMPERLIATRYESAQRAGLVGTISALIGELSGVMYAARARGFAI